jgi:putative ABC transport system permease protein
MRLGYEGHLVLPPGLFGGRSCWNLSFSLSFQAWQGIVMATGSLPYKFQLQGVDTSEMMFANPSVDLGVVFIALSILIISGLIAGLIPAQNAIKIKPVDALRTE